ncbi:MAG: hypothetical protein WA047_06705 [Phenylobacterium sp.]|uniref:hypothetical protein n=1 Tax=Phenylobacterium sp. TaxID=1871053 RepID=UPI003BB569A7
MLVIKSAFESTNTDLALLSRDPLTVGDNNGVRFIGDLGFPYSYPGGIPANLAVVKDVAGHADGQAVIAGGVTHVGNGFDFSGVSAIGNYLSIPASVSADIYGAGGGATATAARTGAAVTSVSVTAPGAGYVAGEPQAIFSGGGGSGAAGTVVVDGSGAVTGVTVTSGGSGYSSDPTVTIVPGPQYFMACLYVKLPLLADWPTSTNIATLLQFDEYLSFPDLLTLDMKNTSSKIESRRQTAAGTAAFREVIPQSGDYGGLAQIIYWRNASGVGLRLKTANGAVLATTTPGSPNTQDFSAKTGKAGIGPKWWNNSLVQDVNAKKWRLYRVFIENLRRSGRDPVAVADADYARFAARVARGEFS